MAPAGANKDPANATSVSKRQSSSAAKSEGTGPWDNETGWQAVEVTDDFLVGLKEGGFMGLEVLDNPTLLTENEQLGPNLLGEAVEGAQPAAKTGKKKRAQPDTQKAGTPDKSDTAAAAVNQTAMPSQPLQPRKKRRQSQASEGAPDASANTAALEAQLAQLQAENQQLQQQLQCQVTGNKGAQQPEPAAGQQAKPAKRKSARKKEKLQQFRREKRKEKRAAGKVATPTAPLHWSSAAGDAAAVSDSEAEELADSGVAAGAAKAEGADVSAWASFGLQPAVLRGLAALGFSTPTPIQRDVLPPAIHGRRDIIGAAETGSGKTLAFGLPIMQVLAQELEAAEDEPPSAHGSGGPLRALILTPTRELAMQVCKHLEAIGRGCGVWVVPIVGGISPLKQERLLARRPQVVVASPGRLWDLMQAGHPQLTQLRRLSFLVIDEADRMVQQGHFQELESILDFVAAGRGATTNDEPGTQSGADAEAVQGDAAQQQEAAPAAGFIQTMVFSATLTLPEALRKRLKKGGGGSSGSAALEALMAKLSFRGRPKVCDLTTSRRLAERVAEAHIQCGEAERDSYLYYLLARHPGRTLVFVNAVSSLRRVAALLKLLGLPAHPLHASMQQRQRLKAVDRFRDDEDGVLVATDVAARGLDIENIRCVIHYQVPASVDVYVHRSGRTGRGSQGEGVAVALVVPKEAARFLALHKALDRPLPPEFPVETGLMPAVQKRVGLAERLDRLLRTRSKAHTDTKWRQRHAQELEIDLSDEEEDSEDEQRTHGNSRLPDNSDTVEEVQEELAGLLAEPLQPKFSGKYFTGGAAAALLPPPAAAATPEGGHPGSSSSQQGRQAAQQAALAAALHKRQLKKAGNRSKLVVIPGAFGRDTAAPDALAALRMRQHALAKE